MSVQTLNIYNFERLVKKSSTPSLIKFWHAGCHLCVNLGPMYKKLSEEYKDKFNFFEVDTTDKQVRGLSRGFNIDGVPEIYMFHKNTIVEIPWPDDPSLYSGFEEWYLIKHFDELLGKVEDDKKRVAKF